MLLLLLVLCLIIGGYGYITDSNRVRAMAQFLSLGHSGLEAAERFQVCPGRVTQLRQRWRREWLAFQGEPTARA